ncbi:hypothetical protein DL96DRAFT_1620656 [Flagelloscypha sp. PMI_526]|nr:hypothetical protein DL96DRAFT_1620656 [Flagelloscypha sp. PMI_526]
MSTPVAGTAQESLLESSPILNPSSTRQRFPKIRAYIGLACYALPLIFFSSFIFFSSVALGRVWLVHEKTPEGPSRSAGAREEYIAAALAGILFSISCGIIFTYYLFVGQVRTPSRIISFLDNFKNPFISLPLNFLIGGPLYLVLSGLILKLVSIYPDIQVGAIVGHYLVALPVVVVGLVVVSGLGLCLWNMKRS